MSRQLTFTYQRGMQRRQIPGGNSFWHVRVEDGVREICAYAFSNVLPHNAPLELREEEAEKYKHLSLERVEIAVSVEKILHSGFYCCNNLVQIDIPEDSRLTMIGNSALSFTSITKISFPSPLKHINDLALAACTKLKTVLIPNNSNRGPSHISSLGVACFAACLALSELDLSQCPDLTAIPIGAFFGCHSLQRVLLPPNLRNISGGAFAFCKSLQAIEFPNALESIGELAFYACRVKAIFIPASVRRIGEKAFGSCPLLEKIEFVSIATLRDVMLQKPSPPQDQQAYSEIIQSLAGLTPVDVDNEYVPTGPQFHSCPSLHTVLWPQTEIPMALWPRLIVRFFGAHNNVGGILDPNRPERYRMSSVYAALLHHHDKRLEQQNAQLCHVARRSKRRRQPVVRYGSAPAPPNPPHGPRRKML